MSMSKIKFAGAIVVMVLVIGAGAVLLAYRVLAADRATVEAKEAAQKQGETKEEAKLVAELFAAANEEWTGRLREFEAGRGTQEFLHAAARRLLQAELEKAKTKEERIAARKAQLDRMAEVEKVNKARFEKALIPIQDYQAARFWRLEAELALLRAKRQ